MEFLIKILFLLVGVYVAHLVIGFIKVPEVIKTVAYLVVGLAALLVLLGIFGVAVPGLR